MASRSSRPVLFRGLVHARGLRLALRVILDQGKMSHDRGAFGLTTPDPS
jgi:hypothetical protein